MKKKKKRKIPPNVKDLKSSWILRILKSHQNVSTGYRIERVSKNETEYKNYKQLFESLRK